MKKAPMIAAAALALCAALSPSPVFAQGPPPPGYGREAWRNPPRQYNAVKRQGFMDGMEGARKDVENHRRPTPENRDEYRSPNVAPRDRSAYREGFRRGYQAAFSHMRR